MGYTHYWLFVKPIDKYADEVEALYQKAIKDCVRVIKAYNVRCFNEGLHDNRLSGYTVHTKPGQYGGIEVNGTKENGHEPFILREHFNQNAEFSFCKTAYKPYDEVVVACLAILKYRLIGFIEVSSDGNRDDWRLGVALAGRVIRRAVPNPIQPCTTARRSINPPAKKTKVA